MGEIRIGTWNMQGCSIEGTDLLNTACGLLDTVDVLCLQECGKLQERTPWKYVQDYPGLFVADLNAGTGSRAHNLRIYHYPFGSNPHCSMAVLVDLDVFPKDYFKPYLIRATGNIRPCVGVFSAEWGVFCVHAPSANEALAQSTVSSFTKTIDKNLRNGVFKKAVIAGDFNISPDQLESPKGYVGYYATDDSGNMILTHPSSSACYDYCITKNAKPQGACILDATSGLSDHLGVAFLLE